MTLLSGMWQHDQQPWPIFWAATSKARPVGTSREWRNPANKTCFEGSFTDPDSRRIRERILDAFGIFSKPHPLPGPSNGLFSKRHSK